jgi:hypothetical protein
MTFGVFTAAHPPAHREALGNNTCMLFMGTHTLQRKEIGQPKTLHRKVDNAKSAQPSHNHPIHLPGNARHKKKAAPAQGAAQCVQSASLCLLPLLRKNLR